MKAISLIQEESTARPKFASLRQERRLKWQSKQASERARYLRKQRLIRLLGDERTLFSGFLVASAVAIVVMFVVTQSLNFLLGGIVGLAISSRFFASTR